MDLVRKLLMSPMSRKKNANNSNKRLSMPVCGNISGNISLKFKKKSSSPNKSTVSISMHQGSSSHLFNTECSGELKYFGECLEDILARERGKVPQLVIVASKFIYEKGLEQEGLFRVSGNARAVENLKMAIGRTGVVFINDETDVGTVASLLKMFFRELPDSLIPQKMTNTFLEAISDDSMTPENTYKELKHLCSKLPSYNYSTLKYLIQLLVLVARHESHNKMSPHALGIVFGPNIFRTNISNQGLTNYIVSCFINGYDSIFRTKEEELPHEEHEKHHPNIMRPAPMGPRRSTRKGLPPLALRVKPAETDLDIRNHDEKCQAVGREMSPLSIVSNAVPSDELMQNDEDVTQVDAKDDSSTDLQHDEGDREEGQCDFVCLDEEISQVITTNLFSSAEDVGAKSRSKETVKAQRKMMKGTKSSSCDALPSEDLSRDLNKAKILKDVIHASNLSIAETCVGRVPHESLKWKGGEDGKSYQFPWRQLDPNSSQNRTKRSTVQRAARIESHHNQPKGRLNWVVSSSTTNIDDHREQNNDEQQKASDSKTKEMLHLINVIDGCLSKKSPSSRKKIPSSSRKLSSTFTRNNNNLGYVCPTNNSCISGDHSDNSSDENYGKDEDDVEDDSYENDEDTEIKGGDAEGKCDGEGIGNGEEEKNEGMNYINVDDDNDEGQGCLDNRRCESKHCHDLNTEEPIIWIGHLDHLDSDSLQVNLSESQTTHNSASSEVYNTFGVLADDSTEEKFSLLTNMSKMNISEIEKFADFLRMDDKSKILKQLLTIHEPSVQDDHQVAKMSGSPKRLYEKSIDQQLKPEQIANQKSSSPKRVNEQSNGQKVLFHVDKSGQDAAKTAGSPKRINGKSHDEKVAFHANKTAQKTSSSPKRLCKMFDDQKLSFICMDRPEQIYTKTLSSPKSLSDGSQTSIEEQMQECMVNLQRFRDSLGILENKYISRYQQKPSKVARMIDKDMNYYESQIKKYRIMLKKLKDMKKNLSPSSTPAEEVSTLCPPKDCRVDNDLHCGANLLSSEPEKNLPALQNKLLTARCSLEELGDQLAYHNGDASSASHCRDRKLSTSFLKNSEAWSKNDASTEKNENHSPKRNLLDDATNNHLQHNQHQGCGQSAEQDFFVLPNKFILQQEAKELREWLDSSPDLKRQSRLHSMSQEIPENLRKMKAAMEKIERELEQLRNADARDFSIGLMTREELKREKMDMQKSLLQFESTFGRPTSKLEKSLVKSVYARYSEVKKALKKYEQVSAVSTFLRNMENSNSNIYHSSFIFSEPIEKKGNDGEEAMCRLPDVGSGDEKLSDACSQKNSLDDLEKLLSRFSLKQLHDERKRLNDIESSIAGPPRKDNQGFHSSSDNDKNGSKHDNYIHLKELKAQIGLINTVISKHSNKLNRNDQ